jgi:hypothetical protein
VHPLTDHHAGNPRSSKLKILYFGGYYHLRLKDRRPDGRLVMMSSVAFRPTVGLTDYHMNLNLQR